MNGDALKEAIKALLAHGDNAKDQGLMKMAAAKKAPPPAAPEMCPDCNKPLVDGKCESCGYESPAADDDSGGTDLADLLDSGAKE